MRPRHMSAVSSSSTRKPIDTTLSVPPRRPSTSLRRDLARAVGGLASPAEPAVDAEHARDVKPQMSASSTPTVQPRAASAAARFTVTDDLPTPPLPLADRDHARGRRAPRWAAPSATRASRARCISAERSAPGSSRRTRRCTSPTPGRPRDLRLRRRCRSGPGAGTPAVVSATLHGDVAVGADLDVVDHARGRRSRRAARGRARPRACRGRRRASGAAGPGRDGAGSSGQAWPSCRIKPV